MHVRAAGREFAELVMRPVGILTLDPPFVFVLSPENRFSFEKTLLIASGPERVYVEIIETAVAHDDQKVGGGEDTSKPALQFDGKALLDHR
jgi:hypothetical protein